LPFSAFQREKKKRRVAENVPCPTTNRKYSGKKKKKGETPTGNCRKRGKKERAGIQAAAAKDSQTRGKKGEGEPPSPVLVQRGEKREEKKGRCFFINSCHGAGKKKRPSLIYP